MADMENFEAVPALGDDIHTAVFIFLGDSDDFSSATDLGDRSFFGAHYAENLIPLEALPDHFFVAGLKDVQRQRSAGQQNHVQRKQRQQRTQARPPAWFDRTRKNILGLYANNTSLLTRRA